MKRGEETHAYRALCEHGKVRAMTVDDSLTTGHCLKDLRDFRRWAHSTDRVPMDEARKSDMDCPDCDAVSAKKQKRQKKVSEEVGLFA